MVRTDPSGEWAPTFRWVPPPTGARPPRAAAAALEATRPAATMDRLLRRPAIVSVSANSVCMLGTCGSPEGPGSLNQRSLRGPPCRPSRAAFERPFCDYVRDIFKRNPDLPMFKARACSRRRGSGGRSAGEGSVQMWAHAGGRELNRRSAATAAAGDPTQGLVATQGQGGPGQGGQLIQPQLLQWGGPLLRRVGRQWCTVAGALRQTAGWLRPLRASCLVKRNHPLLLRRRLLLLLLLCCCWRRRPCPLS